MSWATERTDEPSLRFGPAWSYRGISNFALSLPSAERVLTRKNSQGILNDTLGLILAREEDLFSRLREAAMGSVGCQGARVATVVGGEGSGGCCSEGGEGGGGFD